ncbi:MAG: dipeptidase [Calditrichota bacterium]
MTKTSHRIIDGHNDAAQYLYVPDKLPGYKFIADNAEAAVDLPKLREGNVKAGFFAIFNPPMRSEVISDAATYRAIGFRLPPLPSLPHARAQQQAIEGMVELLRLEKNPDSQLSIIRSLNDLIRCLNSDETGIIVHLEGAEAIDAKLNALEVFYQSGLRSLGITWSRPNIFGHGVPFKFPSSPDTGPGLTELGQKLVRRCNEMGIMLDLAHLNQKGFWEVATISEAPLVSTHTAVHSLCESSRNLTDAQIDAIGSSGGLIGITFYVGDLREDGEENPDTPISRIVDHIEYVAERIGVDHVALGSDFDGAMMPKDLYKASLLPRLISELEICGFSEEDIEKICHKNWIRVLYHTWKE